MTQAEVQWDAWQREALAEMGFTAFRLSRAEPALPRDFPPALYAALQRAAGAGHARVAGLPGLVDLPADPAAKRALWPRVRRLRMAIDCP